jgi:chromosome segregation ATPase
MTRGESAVLATGLADLRERQAVSETKLDAVAEAMKTMAAKIDTIIDGQSEGRTDRAELRAAIESVQAEIKGMKPDVETVRAAKLFWKVALWVGGAAGAIAGAIATAKGWIVFNLNWFAGK